MTRVIFQAGLGWKMFDEKWPNFKKAFKNFVVDEVAKFGDGDIKRLVNDASIVRNKAKIVVAIENAKQFQNIRNTHGSFRAFIDSLDKSNNYDLVVKELGKKFSRLGPSSARIFLFTVGENVRHAEEE